MTNARKPRIPALLLFASCAGVALAGVLHRVTEAERRHAIEVERDRLRVLAADAAAILADAAVGLLREVRTQASGTGLVVEGVFVRPRAPQRLVPLVRDVRADPVGEFFLAEAARAEAVDPLRAAGLYRAAGEPERDAGVRKAAWACRAALDRRGGAIEDAVAAERQLLALLDPAERGSTREGLLARLRLAQAAADDAGLAADLLAPIGGPEEPVALAILRQAGELREPLAAALAARRADLQRMRRWRAVIERPGERGEQVIRVDTSLIAISPLAQGIAIGERLLPALPERVSIDRDPRSVAAADLVETREVGPALAGVRVMAVAPRALAERAARRRSAWIIAGILLLVVASGAALSQTLRAARRSSAMAQAQTRFVAQVGHDLRTPLTLIRMYAETLAEGRVDDPREAREFAGIAAREARRLSGLVERVLDLSRPAPDRSSAPGVDLARVVREVVAAHAPLFAEAGMQCRLVQPVPAPSVRGDEDAIRGALGNLLDNARCHAGGPIDVELRVDDAVASIRVSDRGPGVPVGLEERIFDRFVRGASGGGGAGLGLALVRQVGEHHGGGARVEARAGGGATFILELAVERPA